MQGYGYSVWYVPSKQYDITYIKNRYQVSHTPHVTAATNAHFSKAVLIMNSLPNKVMFQAQDPQVVFPSMYETDPLCAIGFYGTLWDVSDGDCTQQDLVKLQWQPHMSLRYFSQRKDASTHLDELTNLSPHAIQVPIECHKCIVDTRSLHPAEWKVLS